MLPSNTYKVLLVDLARSFGGAEVRVISQAAALNDAVGGCAVAVLANSPIHLRLQKLGITCEVIRAGRASPSTAITLRNIIKRGDYKVVDAHNVQSILWGHLGASWGGVKACVATIHSDYGAEYPGLKGQLYESVLRFDARYCKQYINVTEVLQAKAEERGWGERSTLIHNAVPIPSWPIDPPDHDLRASWGFGPNDFVIGIAARLKPVKGHTYLIEAIAQLKDLIQVKLVIFGDGPLREDLERQVRERGITDKVHFAGFREDILRVLPSVDCSALVSLSEALPFAVLEAASYARPLLCTNVGGLATLLEDNRTAILVPPADAGAIAAAIRRLAKDPELCRRLGTSAYQYVGEHFSLSRMIEKTIGVYEKALAEA